MDKPSYVRQQLTTALLDLLQEKDLNDITVSQLTEKAQVGRVSFYRQFTSKEAILAAHIQQLLTPLMSQWETSPTPEQSNTYLGQLFGHFDEHRDFYLLLSRRGLFDLLRQELKTRFGPKPTHSNFEAYVTAYFSYGLFGWIDEWFNRGMVENTEEIVTYLNNRQ